jgi:hypothetical protein
VIYDLTALLPTPDDLTRHLDDLDLTARLPLATEWTVVLEVSDDDLDFVLEPTGGF